MVRKGAEGGGAVFADAAPRLTRRDAARLAVDGGAWFVGLFFAALARYDFDPGRVDARALFVFAGAAVILQWLIGTSLYLYRGRYRYGSFDEVSGVATTVVIVGVVLAAFDLIIIRNRSVPASAPIMGAFIALVLMLAVRYVRRSLVERAARPDHETATKVLVFGAGNAGSQLVQSMMRDPASHYRPVGLLDDDPRWRNLRVSGVAVLGGRGAMASAAKSTGATVLVIAIARADASMLRDLNGVANDAGLSVKVIPTVAELMDGRVTSADVRDINEADLLGRHQVETDLDAIAHHLMGKRVMVTGAGGSIGSELCRQISRYGPAELIMLDRDESALHSVQLSLHGRALLDTDATVLADIRDAARVDTIFEQRRPEVVFHAAALKHLPLLEQYPDEAFKSNVIGTLNVLQAAARSGVSRFVNISTDKAANPISALGYSKRVAERLTAHVASVSEGTFLSVRFGNVLGSRGSVLTSFASQIENGGPITVTDPEVTRYFMTVQEAVQLVIQAAAIGRDGEALVLDMGEPVRIADVARQMAAQAPRHIDIVFTGLRPGEKLHEDLLADDEVAHRTAHPLVMQVAVDPLDPDEMAGVEVGANRLSAIDALSRLAVLGFRAHTYDQVVV
jgi:FlaA1/EpsC-like NDP-sugar epimerase